MSLELKLEDYFQSSRLIDNFDRFHELNANALTLIRELDVLVEDFTSKNKPYKKGQLSTTYCSLKDTIEEMILLTNNPKYNPEKPKKIHWDISELKDYTKALKGLDEILRSSLEQIDLYCKMGYDEHNSELKEEVQKFKDTLMGKSEVKAKGKTIEELVRVIHNHYYFNFEKLLSGREELFNETRGYIPNEWDREKAIIPYFAVNEETISDNIQHPVDIINKLIAFNDKNPKKRGSFYRDDDKSAIYKNAIIGLSTKSYMNLILQRDDLAYGKLYLTLIFDSSKEKYRLNFHYGTKNHINDEKQKIYAGVFKQNGWSYNLERWSSKDIKASIEVDREDLEPALTTMFMLAEYECDRLYDFNKPIKKPEDLQKRIDEFYKAYTLSTIKK